MCLLVCVAVAGPYEALTAGRKILLARTVPALIGAIPDIAARRWHGRSTCVSDEQLNVVTLYSMP
ncbi:hypothetical protein GCM10010129_67490 [Streptomyces fumigatiscleroticus]|nr:hypothetical protein GCM10010129_67490 [Streptomyces fumigatiscleroticus]